jgi:RNA recognition motif-containing protein
MSQTKIYVGNLSYNVDSDMLREHFSQCGSITEAKVIMDRDTHRSKGFGFVTFSNKTDMLSALNLNGTSLDGRQMKVNQAQESGGSRGGAGNRCGGFGRF